MRGVTCASIARYTSADAASARTEPLAERSRNVITYESWVLPTLLISAAAGSLMPVVYLQLSSRRRVRS